MESRMLRLSAHVFVVAACLALVTPNPAFGQADRETWQPPEKIMDAVGVKPGMKIGEAGAGRGYFTFPLSGRVGAGGVVFANDISTSSLDTIRSRASAEGIDNIRIVVGAVEDPLFPEKDLDMVVMVYVLHMLETPVEFMKNLRKYIGADGTLVVIERNAAHERAHYPSFMTRGQVLETMEDIGYELVRTETFLPRDTIFIYAPK